MEGPAPPSWSPQAPDQASQLVSPSHAVASASGAQDEQTRERRGAPVSQFLPLRQELFERRGREGVSWPLNLLLCLPRQTEAQVRPNDR